MKSRAVIEQAKGKLMASGRYHADQAFEVLARASQRSNIRLRDMADGIVNGMEPIEAPTSQS
jgi:AmiR/NasT family two-component response regulator